MNIHHLIRNQQRKSHLEVQVQAMIQVLEYLYINMNLLFQDIELKDLLKMQFQRKKNLQECLQITIFCKAKKK